MKHLVLFLSILLISINSYTQIYEWTQPTQITPAGEDCFNAKITAIELDSLIGKEKYIVYNKKINDSTTGIFARLAYNYNNEITIYHEEGKICYYNDAMLNHNHHDSGVFLFFELQNYPEEQRDIYSLIIDDGVISGPFPIATTQEDEHHLSSTGYPNRIVWQCGDTIKTIYYEDINGTLVEYEEMIVKAGDCFSPIIDNEGKKIRFLEQDGNRQLIRETEITDTLINFSIDTLFIGHEIKSLKNTPCLWGWEGPCTWQNYNEGHKIFLYNYDMYTNKTDSISWIQEQSFNPAFLKFHHSVKDFYSAGCIAIELNNDTTNDIYASIAEIPHDIEYLTNVSKSENIVQNPALFVGNIESWLFDVLLIYEEIMDGKRQLMFSMHQELYGGTNENKHAKNNITISPNPITSNFFITINNPETSEMQFTLYNLNGMKSKTLSRNVNVRMANEISFSVKDFGNAVAPGPYVLKIIDGKKTESLKVMII